MQAKIRPEYKDHCTGTLKPSIMIIHPLKYRTKCNKVTAKNIMVENHSAFVFIWGAPPEKKEREETTTSKQQISLGYANLLRQQIGLNNSLPSRGLSIDRADCKRIYLFACKDYL